MGMISDRVLNMEESATLKMAGLAWQLKSEGKDIISLSLGEPDFDTPDFVKKAAIDAINNNFTHYPPVPGYPELKNAISHKFQRDNKLKYDAAQIVVSTGAKHSLMNLVLATVNPGEKVLLPAPYWVSYMAMVEFAEGKPIVVETDIKSDFKITPELLESYIDDECKMFIFSNPCNPSGSVYSESELRALANVFEKYPKCIIVADEIYELINFDDNKPSFSMGCIDSIKDRAVTVNGVAKGFAMTGWRIGYIGAPLEIAKACTKLQGQFTSGANTIAQMATISALEEDPKNLQDMKKVFKKRRDLIVGLLKKIPGLEVNTPEGAFYVFPEISSFFGKKSGDIVINTADDLCMFILEDSLVAMTGGAAFGCPNNIRLSYASSDDKLIEAVARIEKSLAKLS